VTDALLTLPVRRFERRTAIVTAAAAGIGRAMAIRLASEGAAVACVDTTPEAVEVTVDALRTIGGHAVAYGCDVTDEASVAQVVGRVASELGTPTVLANVTGLGGFARAENLALAAWEQTMARSLRAPFLMARSVLPHMLGKPGGGSIVNVASTAGLAGAAYLADSCAAHGGLLMLTKALAAEYADQGVRVNAIASGGVDTAAPAALQLPDGADRRHLFRWLSPSGHATTDQVAAAAVFLASDEAGHITGAVLTVDGGITA
jgi:NAD(P)-dependent dehydrogenase (short-subunit alcohol dehydrogenase family)